MATAAQIALLRARLGAGTQDGSLSDTELGLLWDQAAETLGKYIGDTVVPEATRTRCTLDVADRLHTLEVSPNGQPVFVDLDGGGGVARIARDPLIGVYPILSLYMAGPIS